MVIGGGDTPAGNTCGILDLGVANPQWKYAASMKNVRTMPDAVLLPDGKVLVVNGCASGSLMNATKPVLEGEVYDPTSDKWTTLAPMKTERLYHATALLLPDARVLTAGTDRQWNNATIKQDYAHTQLEVFSPPYLFWGPHPTIRLAPESVSYGTAFEVATDDADTIKSAVLIRNGSCTHSFNSDQRFVELEIKKRMAPKLWVRWTKQQVSSRFGSFTFSWPAEFFVSRGLELQTPPNGFVAPEGYYMLFLVSNGGVPSKANFVRLG
jgi:galactose oxidase